MLRNLRGRRLLLSGIAVVGLVAALLISPVVTGGTAKSAADQPTGCDFTFTGSGPSCQAPLIGSDFAGGDGNMLAPTGETAYSCDGATGGPSLGLPPCNGPGNFGTTDWQNVGNVVAGNDVAPPAEDNGFTGGSEVTPTVTIGQGPSVVNGGADLSRFYEASQFLNDQNFLYLAWQAVNNAGERSVDFELNQQPTGITAATRGTVTIPRTPGDLLITFDFTNGGAAPKINVLTWLTSANASLGSCLSGSIAAGCWGAERTLTQADAIASVNNWGNVGGNFNTAGAGLCNPPSKLPAGCQVYDPFRPISGAQAPGGTNTGPNNGTGTNFCSVSSSTGPNIICKYYENPVPATRFGEIAINLTATGLIPQGTCESFVSVMAKTRSSTSLTSSLKDLIAPIPVYLSNCLQVSVGYQDNDGGAPSTRPGPTEKLVPWGQMGTPEAMINGMDQGVAHFVGCEQKIDGSVSHCSTAANLPAPHTVYDGGALLFTNTSVLAGVNGGAGEKVPISNASVNICSAGTQNNTCANPNATAGGAFNCTFRPWGSGTFNVPPGDGSPGTNQMILTQTGIDTGTLAPPFGPPGSACNVISAPFSFTENFDTSEAVPSSDVVVINGVFVCPVTDPENTPDDLVPIINFSAPGPNGTTLPFSIRDTQQILNTGGVDRGCVATTDDQGDKGINETTQYVPVS